MRFHILAITLIGSLFVGNHFAAAEIEWRSSLEAAKMEAIQTGKPVLIHFYGDGCPPCRLLERRAFKDDQLIASMNANAIPVKVNATQDRRTAQDYSVRAWPTDVFLFPNGQEAFRSVSKQDPNQYAKIVERVALQNRDWVIAYNKAQESSNGPTNASPAQPRRNLLARDPATVNERVPAQSVAANTSDPRAAAYQLPRSGSGQARQPGPSQASLQPALVASQPSVQSGGAPIVSAPRLNQAPQQLHTTPAAQQLALQQRQQIVPPQAAGQLSVPQGYSLANTAPSVATLTPTQNQPQAFTNSAGNGLTNGSSSRATATNSVAASGGAPQFRAPVASNPPVSTPQVFTPPTAPTAVTYSANANNPAASAPGLAAPTAGPTNLAANRYTNTTVTRPSQPTLTLASGQAKPNIFVSNKNSQSSQSAAIGLDGYCPVSLTNKHVWAEGKPELAVRHRGRVYQFADEQCRAEFLKQPDTYAPALSGYDIVTFLEEGKLVSGSREFGFDLGAGTPIFLFSSRASMERFKSAGSSYLQMLESVSNGASQGRVANELNSGAVVR